MAGAGVGRSIRSCRGTSESDALAGEDLVVIAMIGSQHFRLRLRVALDCCGSEKRAERTRRFVRLRFPVKPVTVARCAYESRGIVRPAITGAGLFGVLVLGVDDRDQ